MSMSKYRIVNTFDRPCEKLIAELREDGKLYYVHPEFANGYEGMDSAESAPVEDFGVTLSETAGGQLSGNVTHASSATYDDSRRRLWQGSDHFGFDMVRTEIKKGGAK